MNKFVLQLLTEWRKLDLPFEDQTLVVAISGGADSVALALALNDLRKRKKLNPRFVLAHFNHDLRGAESERDAEFVRNFAQKFHFELALGKGKIPTEGNLEQNARLARYEFLRDTAENLRACGILTAHTVNDQAETFLLNLIRGSGVAGLSGMSAKRSHLTKGKGQNLETWLIRPLLNWAKREDTEHFCRENEIAFRRDAMNDDLSFRRVRVRKILLPLLKEFNPKIIETLAATAKLLHSENQSKPKDQTPKTDEYLVLKDLLNLPRQTLYDLLRGWLLKNRGDLRQITLKHVEAIERLITSRKSGRTVELPNGESVLKKGGKLFWQQKNIENIRD